MANYVVELSISTIILFCVTSAKMLMIYINGRHFGAQAFIRAKYPHVKSGSVEGHWAEMSAIYINHQHLRGFYTKENYRGNARLDYIISCSTLTHTHICIQAHTHILYTHKAQSKHLNTTKYIHVVLQPLSHSTNIACY